MNSAICFTIGLGLWFRQDSGYTGTYQLCSIGSRMHALYAALIDICKIAPVADLSRNTVLPLMWMASMSCTMFAESRPRPVSYNVGERYLYGIYVSSELPSDKIASLKTDELKRAATGSIGIVGKRTIGTTECYLIEAHAGVTGWARILNVQLTMASSVDIAFSRSQRFLRETAILFATHSLVTSYDWKQQRTTTSESRRRFIRTKTKTYEGELPNAALDPLSLFFRFRGLELKPGGVVTIPVTDGSSVTQGSEGTNNVLQAKFIVVRREEISIGNEKRDAFLIKPEVPGLRGLVRNVDQEKYRLWISTDRDQVPLKVSGEIKLNPDSELVRLVEAVLE